MLEPSREVDVTIGDVDLRGGGTLVGVVQRVSLYGTPRPDGSNVVLVCHALTGSSRAGDWWQGLVGPGRLFDTDRLAIVCVNALGSCYGSTGPPAEPAASPAMRAERFPVVSVADIVAAQRRALAQLGITRFAAVVGGSLGGMQALRWAVDAPEALDRCIVIGAYDFFSAMGIALNAVAREAIRNGGPRPESGIELARKIAMLTYKSEALFAERYGRKPDRSGGDPYREPAARFDVEGYLDHQGAVFSSRMDPAAYLVLTRAMDLFETRGVPLGAAHTRIAYTFAGISSDWLFLPAYVREAAHRFASAGADSAYVELLSNHGHDAFLAEPDALAALVRPRLASLYAAAH